MTVSPRTVARIVGVIDLTNLSPAATAAEIDALCRKARDRDVAAVCVHIPWVARARDALAGCGVRVATVLNFPAGTADPETVLTQAREAVAAGADELDLVVPYARGAAAVRGMVAAIRSACPDVMLKTILETGELAADDQRAVAEAAVAGGADMLKTSTGMVSVGATPDAAAVLLDVIARADRPVGLKVSGGIRTAEDAAGYLAQADAGYGAAVGPDRFRIGCSGLLDALGDGVAREGY